MIYLLRHGLDDESYVGGHSDGLLVDIGREEIKKVALYIRDNLKIDKIYSSDIKRAVETAEIINQYLNVSITLDASLRELDKGMLTGKKKSDLTDEEIRNLHTKDINEKIFGGESMKNLYDRIFKLYHDGYFDDKDNTLLVTHRGVINMLYVIMSGDLLTMDKKKYGVDHGSIHEMDFAKKLIRRIK